MTTIITTFLILVLAFAAPKIIAWFIGFCTLDDSTEEKIKKSTLPVVWGITTLLLLIIWGFATIRIIPTGAVGVKTRFGVVCGQANEGFNLIAPWEDIVQMNTKIQKKS